jgi:hypothetical protein
LVTLCGIWGISYTGCARLQGRPTHEWIAVRLAERGCVSPYHAAKILAAESAAAFSSTTWRGEQTFLIAGWGLFEDTKRMEPHFLLVTNTRDANGAVLPNPALEFRWFERRLKDGEAYVSRVIGPDLPQGRGKMLDRYFRRLLKKGTSPKPAMKAFVSEIVHTPAHSVGDRVLAFSIPKAAAEVSYRTRQSMLFAKEPDLQSAAFCYFGPDYSEARQHGPTFVCGESAMTDVETESDPTRNYQSSSFRILHTPRHRNG